jgi:hypothetical protein
MVGYPLKVLVVPTGQMENDLRLNLDLFQIQSAHAQNARQDGLIPSNRQMVALLAFTTDVWFIHNRLISSAKKEKDQRNLVGSHVCLCINLDTLEVY